MVIPAARHRRFNGEELAQAFISIALKTVKQP
jgi:hypothetical protein